MSLKRDTVDGIDELAWERAMSQPPVSLRQLRSARTRASNEVRRQIARMILDEAKYTGRDGLPSWWPYANDVLIEKVIKTVRAARALNKASCLPSEKQL